MKTFQEFMVEARKPEYEIYHDSYTSAIQEVEKFVNKKKFILDPEELFSEVGMGPKKPGGGKTNGFSLTLYKNKKDLEEGKPNRKKVHFQVYGMGDGKHLGATRYELNVYIS